jgi:tetratricopeptide (TPR) repeat protein
MQPGITRRSAPILALAALAVWTQAACQSEPKTKIDPEKQFELYSETAFFHFANDDFLHAREQAAKALALQPEHVRMRVLQAQCRLYLGTPAELAAAEREFEALLEDGGRDARFGLAAVQERLGTLFHKASTSVAAGEIDPPAGESADERAAEYRSRAQDYLAKATAGYACLLEERPTDRLLLGGLVRVHALAGRPRESFEFSQRLLDELELERSSWSAQLERANLAQDEEDRFRRNLAEVEELEVENLLLAADSQRRLGELDGALASLEAVVRLRPERPEAYARRAQLRHELGENDAAIADLDLFLRLSERPFEHPDIQQAFDLRAACQMALDREGAAPAAQG